MKTKYLLFAASILMGISLATYATITRYHLFSLKKQVSPADTLFKSHIYDKVLLEKCKRLCQKYDTLKENYTIEGVLNYYDKADSSIKIRDLKFNYCKHGPDYYYLMGKIEILNASGQYISINNESKTIIISKQKTIIEPDEHKMLNSIEDAIRSEAYYLKSSNAGSIKTISLVNEHHISCKQYSISFDTLSMNINHIFCRLTSNSHPLRTDNEKLLNMNIYRWDNKAYLKNFIDNNKIGQVSRELNFKQLYPGYRIIKI